MSWSISFVTVRWHVWQSRGSSRKKTILILIKQLGVSGHNNCSTQSYAAVITQRLLNETFCLCHGANPSKWTNYFDNTLPFFYLNKLLTLCSLFTANGIYVSTFHDPRIQRSCSLEHRGWYVLTSVLGGIMSSSRGLSVLFLGGVLTDLGGVLSGVFCLGGVLTSSHSLAT